MAIEVLLEQAATEGVITCRDCGNAIEVDAEGCYCGWENPLLELGLV